MKGGGEWRGHRHLRRRRPQYCYGGGNEGRTQERIAAAVAACLRMLDLGNDPDVGAEAHAHGAPIQAVWDIVAAARAARAAAKNNRRKS